jgi:hypothetical protein
VRGLAVLRWPQIGRGLRDVARPSPGLLPLQFTSSGSELLGTIAIGPGAIAIRPWAFRIGPRTIGFAWAISFAAWAVAFATNVRATFGAALWPTFRATFTFAWTISSRSIWPRTINTRAA